LPVRDAAQTHPVVNECRQCCSFCDRILHPSGCIQSRCRYLYSYDDEGSGRRFMGCLNKIFKVEIDVGVFDEAQRTRHGYGGVKLTGSPIPQCQVSVESAYGGDGEAFQCVNPGFFDVEDELTSFDLRDSL
jgi:hypothetical protein